MISEVGHDHSGDLTATGSVEVAAPPPETPTPMAPVDAVEPVDSDEAETDEDEVAATPDETRAHLLTRSKRGYAVVLNEFVQQPQGSPIRIGPLHEFVVNGDIRGLRSYLFLLAIISSGEGEDGFSTTLPLAVWARVFDTTREASGRSATSAASKIISRLVERNLITRERRGRGRLVKLTLLRPDGSGEPFARHDENGKLRPYFKLDNAFWIDGWWRKLALPATAMLLVAGHAPAHGFTLRTESVPGWYGWSADTAERGLAALVDEGMVSMRKKFQKEPLAPAGVTRVNFYRLIFGTEKFQPADTDAVEEKEPLSD